MPTRDQITTLCDNYLAAVSKRDPDAVMALFAEGAAQEEPVGSAPNVGKGEIRKFFEERKEVPITVTRFGPVNVVRNRAAFQALVVVEAPGQRRELTSTDVITVDEDGLISEIIAFPDPLGDPQDAPGARVVLG